MVLDIIKNRQSIRSFKEGMPSDEQIEAVLEAAHLAPSWLNVQPWHFIVVKDNETKSFLAKLAPGQSHIEKSPIIIVCCGNLGSWEQEKMKKVLQECLGLNQEQLSYVINNPVINPKLLDNNTVLLRTVEQVTYATAYMTLEAHKQDLGACVVGALGNELTQTASEDYQIAKQKLKLPENVFILSLLLLGIPKEVKIPKKIRKNKNEVISYECYSK